MHSTYKSKEIPIKNKESLERKLHESPTKSPTFLLSVIITDQPTIRPLHKILPTTLHHPRFFLYFFPHFKPTHKDEENQQKCDDRLSGRNHYRHNLRTEPAVRDSLDERGGIRGVHLFFRYGFAVLLLGAFLLLSGQKFRVTAKQAAVVFMIVTTKR